MTLIITGDPELIIAKQIQQFCALLSLNKRLKFGDQKSLNNRLWFGYVESLDPRWRFRQPIAKQAMPFGDHRSRVVSHLFTGSLAGIGKLPALAGWYIRYGMHGIFCTVWFGGSSFLWNFAGTPLKRGAWSLKKGAEARGKGVPAKCTILKVLTEFSFGIG